MSSRSAPSRAAWQAPYPSRPLMPTSNGLSYWMCSLPRRLCPIGAAILSARAITSSCAAAVPAPAKIVTFLAPLIASASARTDSASGITRGPLGAREDVGGSLTCLEVSDVAGQGEDRDAGGTICVVNRAADDARRLGCAGDHLGVHGALGEEPIGVGLLEVRSADLLARDVRGNREYRHPRAVRVVQAIDEVQVARPARPRAHREGARELSLSGSGERAGLLVAHLHPLDTLGTAHRIHNRVEAVAHDAVDVPHPSGDQLAHQLISDGTGAGHASSFG